jgi:hypothetical protein
VPGRGHDLVGRCGLRHERARAGLERTEQLVVTGIHGQDDDADRRVVLPKCPGRFQTTAVGQAQVHDDDLGL